MWRAAVPVHFTEQVAERVRAYEAAGVDFLLLQCSPQLEELERFAEQVMPLVGASREESDGGRREA